MKISNIKNILLGTTLLTLASCGNDFLDQPISGKLSKDQFYKTDQDADQAVTAVYDMAGADYYQAWSSKYMVKEMPSDDSNAGGSNAGDQPGYQSLDKLATLDPTNGNVGLTWKISYYTIYRANLVVNKVQPETNVRKRLIAEAKALRAFTYFDLVALWGDVPLILDEVDPANYTKITRTPKADVYAQIEKDLNEAIADLPLKSEYSAADKFRFSKGAAQALLGKVYLFEEKWPDAVAQFEAVIASGQYSLESSVAKVFSQSGEFGKESLFESSFVSTEKYGWGNFPWGSQPESNIHVQLMGPRSDFYTKAPADSLIGGWGFNTPKKKLYDAFVAAGDVVRRKVTIMSEVELKAAGGNWTAPQAYDYEGYFQRKYGTFSNLTGPEANELNYSTNFRLIRYADVLLMAAEAQYRNGNAGKSQQYLNMVRNRSSLASITPTGNDLFNAIVRERQLELAFEGFRFLDLVRWGLAPTELADEGFVAGKNEVLPIPINEVRTAGLAQNPKY